MQPSARAIFVSSYSRLVADVWGDPTAERQLVENPRALLSSHGLAVPDHVTINIVRNASDEPDLESQVRAWEAMADVASLSLVIPSSEPLGTEELMEDELDIVVGGLAASCSCCCPCCCT